MPGCVWIVIVNYRTADLAIDSLRSLASQTTDLGGGRTMVMDNDSGDGSAATINAAIERNGWTGWAGVVPMEHNGGFAFGNNAGIRAALAGGADYVMLLNPDTIVRPGALAVLRAALDARPATGIVGSLLENADGGVDCSAHRVHSPLAELDAGARLGVLSRALRSYVVSEPPRAEAHGCDWVSGASLMVRREVIESIGLMDEGFFLYFEEVDFCWRAKQAGWEVWYVPQARIVHLEGAATGIRIAARRRPAYWYDSRRRFFVKHYGLGGLILADLLWAAGRASYLARRALGLGGRHCGGDPKRFTFDLLWGDLRAILAGRVRRPAAVGPA